MQTVLFGAALLQLPHGREGGRGSQDARSIVGFRAIATTIYVMHEGARAQGLYSAPIRAIFKALAVPEDVRS
jgi:hypothetical protein